MALDLTLNTTNVTEAKFVNSDHPNGIDLTEIKYKKGSGGRPWIVTGKRSKCLMLNLKP